MEIIDPAIGPDYLRKLSEDELTSVCQEIRDHLVSSVTSTGGHLGSNLGVVELTVALHRVFDSPIDKVVWDIGHQSYVHKMVTGRANELPTLRKLDGLSGYPSQRESVHDIVENSHASTSLAYAGGLARAFERRGETERSVVAVIGDGALTGGMSWEALNNIALLRNHRVVIVVNDNGRSYAPTVGGIASHLAALQKSAFYDGTGTEDPIVTRYKERVGPESVNSEESTDELTYSRSIFESLGFAYVGPLDGHHVPSLEEYLRRAKDYGDPVVVHCITRKGNGYGPAENEPIDRLHTVKPSPSSNAKSPAKKKSWTSVFSEEISVLADTHSHIVAVTAAMSDAVGLGRLFEVHPDRVMDTGIAEQYAVTSAAGMALGGLHPVVSIYSTFLNRAFDQIVLDVALHGCGVTFVLDRAGATGEDGPSHNGMWDLSLLQVVPSLHIAAPRDAPSLVEQLREAVRVDDAPTAIRFPKGEVTEDLPASRRIDGIDVLHEGTDPEILLVGIGAMAPSCVAAAKMVEEYGIDAAVVDPRWIKPVPDALVHFARRFRYVVSVEDSGRVGGFGSAISQRLTDANVMARVHSLGLPQDFPEHCSRSELLNSSCLTPHGIASSIQGILESDSAHN
ncbi:1-deoxy-D-xylulose-5-phosphate synthase [Actinopolyspora biskrensis]|uniref:1-deoxy-D-xylulose-5-phosphate synthase n=1 Tax=Actinopolyspora biskrensis TaxID=1470178 RepID=A0A852Z1J6_9ACTN|nr:1-deoxy-D-xylulose-5-phosphate synthase [Actinopolyspora biskrensis]NYH77516.1 1-deoxy-D-xylulose-5-phosphate synthase [Actinopolyspora biskrensis]